MNSPQAQIFAVVVTFNPQLDDLLRQLLALVGQVSKIVIVDNGSPICLYEWVEARGLSSKLVVLKQSENFGIAYAQNIGIEYAKCSGADYVIIFDQDSCPSENMVKQLYAAACGLIAKGVILAAVAPCYRDTEDGELSGFVRLSLFGFSRVDVKSISEPIPVDFLISSGCLVPLASLAQIGLMDASLFIDHVDTEWCFRAKSKGYLLYGVPSAVMLHSLGDRRSRLWFLRWRSVSHHSAFRYYYIIRNSFLLQRRSYMPWKWKLGDFARCIRLVLFFGILANGRVQNLKMMIKGAIDGVRGKSGKLGSQ